MQTVREEDHNLYFNAKSSWRWCEFSAHPRVMLYADRTGVELTDIRVRHTCVACWRSLGVVIKFFSFLHLSFLPIWHILPPPLSFPPSRWILPSVTLCFVSATLQGVVVGRDSFCPDIWEMSTPSTTSSALRYKQTHKYRSTVCLNTQNLILNSSTDPKDANYGKWVWDDACDRQNISIWWMFALPATLQISEWIGNLKDLVMHCIIVLSICNPIWIWFLTLF